jgi:hypothetical protein
MGKKYDQSGKYSRTCEKVEMDGKWTREILKWYPRGCDRKQGRPSGGWADELRRMCASPVDANCSRQTGMEVDRRGLHPAVDGERLKMKMLMTYTYMYVFQFRCYR